MDPTIFKAYDVLGIHPGQLSEDDAWKIGTAAGRFLPSLIRGYERGLANAQCICVGRDMRKHSPALAARLIEGIRCSGANVIDLGQIDTPQMLFAINHLNTCGGIQVTASHLGAHHNGFKISGHRALPIGTDTGLGDIRHLATSLIHTKGNPTGTVTEMDLTEDYRRHVLRFLSGTQKPLKVAIDASNGMAGKLFPILFADLPIKPVEINFKRSGVFDHVPNPLEEKALRKLKGVTRDRACDFGVCFDGDADQLAIVDEQGHRVGNDLLAALMVPYFLRRKPKAVVVYDLRSSRVVPQEIIRHEGTPRKERVGRAYMRKAMRDTHAVFGAAMSGHFYYQDNFSAESALVTFVHLLNILSEADNPLSELLNPLRRLHASGELSFTVEDRAKTLATLARQYAEGNVNHLDGVTVDFKDWWFNCRPSTTQPVLRLNVEAEASGLLQAKVRDLVGQLGEPIPSR